ncbi:MAG: hypothetical protein KC910_30215, partial [Candidatus Eremiobacteraeota bacterium]|nr:hypothetical protein [Candidatus Eremiobacteraeota bacterium]
MSPRLTRSRQIAFGSLLLALAMAALLAYPRPLRDISAGDRIELKIQNWSKVRRIVWERRGNFYLSPGSKIPVEQVDALHQAAVASRQPCDPLEEMGFVADEKLLIARACQRFPWLRGESPSIDLAAAARSWAESLPSNRPDSEFPLSLDLNLGGEPNLRLSTRAEGGHPPRPFPVWHVQAGDQQWETPSPKLSAMAQALSPASGDTDPLGV